MIDASRLLACRRAVEALRCGVPSRTAVDVLGSNQQRIEQRFRRLTCDVAQQRPGGLLIGGGFGSGKSHALQYLAGVGLAEGFVVSTVMVSKDVPLHDHAKVYATAVDTMAGTSGPGSTLEQILGMIDLTGPAYDELIAWSRRALDPRFELTLRLFRLLHQVDDDLADRIVRFWSGANLRMADFRKPLRELGRGSAPPRCSADDLARQRLTFMGRLLAAAGYRGWILLFDEVELISRYSLVARARAYRELGAWFHHSGPSAPVGAVFAMTDDYGAAVLHGRHDLTKLPERLRARNNDDAEALAQGARVGMDVIEHDMVLVSPADRQERDRVHDRLRELHGAVYEWQPPDLRRGNEVVRHTTSMREHVRQWTAEWDRAYIDGHRRCDVPESA